MPDGLYQTLTNLRFKELVSCVGNNDDRTMKLVNYRTTGHDVPFPCLAKCLCSENDNMDGNKNLQKSVLRGW